MSEIPLHYIYTYNDVDKAFWQEHLEDWVPGRIIDAHTHVNDPKFQIETVTEENLRSSWAVEASPTKPDAATAERCYGVTFPGRRVTLVAFGHVDLGWEIEGSNEDTRVEALKRGWYSLAVVRPTWVAEQVDWLLSKPGVLGVKPYYTMIGYSRDAVASQMESSIFAFLPHHQLEVLDVAGGVADAACAAGGPAGPSRKPARDPRDPPALPERQAHHRAPRPLVHAAARRGGLPAAGRRPRHLFRQLGRASTRRCTSLRLKTYRARAASSTAPTTRSSTCAAGGSGGARRISTGPDTRSSFNKEREPRRDRGQIHAVHVRGAQRP